MLRILYHITSDFIYNSFGKSIFICSFCSNKLKRVTFSVYSEFDSGFTKVYTSYYCPSDNKHCCYSYDYNNKLFYEEYGTEKYILFRSLRNPNNNIFSVWHMKKQHEFDIPHFYIEKYSLEQIENKLDMFITFS